MSDLSLLTGVYASVASYAALIDKVIERLRAVGSDSSDPDQRRLGQLLIDSSDQGRSSRSLEALILDSLLRTETGECIIEVKQLGESLLGSDPNKSNLKQLELLAKELEKERAEVANRLRGR